MPEYIGLTIGPIYPTMKQARRTRELWGASFLFSSLFKEIAIQLKDFVILPYVDDKTKSAVGLYPDRIIFTSENEKREKLTVSRVHEVIDNVFTTIAKDIDKKRKNKDALDHLKNAIQIQGYQVNLQADENIIFSIFDQLDNLELFNQIPDTTNVLLEYFDKIGTTKLYKLAGKKGTKFPSTFDISAFSLNKNPNYDAFIINHFNEVDTYERTKSSEAKERLESFIKNCKSTFGEEFKPYHKYFALVHGDGDNMGRIVKSIGHKEEDIKKFSEALYRFGKEAGKIITKYGGLPVYIGGDDLLFFAPLANPRGGRSKNILELINELDLEFLKKKGSCQSMLKLVNDRSIVPSFSYGVSVNFCKYPLKESLENSYLNLQRAKSAETFPHKNAVVITLQKHSGQQIEAEFDKKDVFYTSFLFPFIQKNCFPAKKRRNDSFIRENDEDKLYLEKDFTKRADEYNSFRRKSSEYHFFLKYASSNGGSVGNFIKKNFSEHDFENDGYWKQLLEILEATYADPGTADKKKEMLYFAIRFIHFINSDTNE